jgi:hypothetical protein
LAAIRGPVDWEVGSRKWEVGSSVNNILPAGTYTLWALAFRYTWRGANTSNIRLIAEHGAATFTVMPQFDQTYGWIRLGTLAVNPAQPFGFAGTGIGDGTALYLRGIYLTTGSETPVCMPSGFGGDQRTC